MSGGAEAEVVVVRSRRQHHELRGCRGRVCLWRQEHADTLHGRSAVNVYKFKTMCVIAMSDKVAEAMPAART